MRAKTLFTGSVLTFNFFGIFAESFYVCSQCRPKEGAMSLQHFVTGMKVKLISGGDAMTVESVNGDKVTCVLQVGMIEQRHIVKASLIRPYVPRYAKSIVFR
jgi:uncharacterized protein YodC (DUF2158 family)